MLNNTKIVFHCINQLNRFEKKHVVTFYVKSNKKKLSILQISIRIVFDVKRGIQLHILSGVLMISHNSKNNNILEYIESV